MKKLIVLFLSIIILTGCSNTSQMQVNYNKYMKELSSANTNSDYIPCDIEIKYDKITEEEVMYQVVLDNPKENMRNINVVVTHNAETDDGYPSIGVFDQDPINLSVIRTDDDKNKGIVLVGYFKYSGDIKDLDTEFKVCIDYVNDAIEEHEIYYIERI